VIPRPLEKRAREGLSSSKYELEQRNHYDQTDQKDDANGTTEKFQHGQTPF
jgi:hypothetical protein